MSKQNKLESIINRARGDANFRDKLMANPEDVLNDEGYVVPTGVQMHVFEETSKDKYIIIPNTNELSAAELKAIVGGASAKGKGSGKSSGPSNNHSPGGNRGRR